MGIDTLFRAYDIRGQPAKDLTPDVMERIGAAFAADLQASRVVVGRDVRSHSPDLLNAAVRGITGAGVDVLNTGLVPYGAVLYTGWTRNLPSAYVTASHLSAKWNGIKFADDHGVGYIEEDNNRIRDRFFADDAAAGDGAATTENVLDAYATHLRSRVSPDDVTVLMDCGNGAASVAAPGLFADAGITVETMHDEPDGAFPNRSSDVTVETLQTLRDRVETESFDIGVAYDGDADRVAVVDDTGRLLAAEQLAAALLPFLPDGPVIANVECSRMLEDVARKHGKQVERVRVGHSYLIKAAQQYDACLAVEKSRHMAVPHVLPLDDGIAASLYVAEAVSRMNQPLSAAVDEFPGYVRDRSAFPVPEEHKFVAMQRVQEQLSQEYENTDTLDGIRVDLPEGWVLIRASNTSPKIRMTVEAETEHAFNELQDAFRPRLEQAIND